MPRELTGSIGYLLRKNYNPITGYYKLLKQRKGEQQEMKKADKEERQKCFDRLGVLIKGMDLPPHKRENVRWLGRNMGIRNSKHKNHDETRALLVEMQRKGYS